MKWAFITLASVEIEKSPSTSSFCNFSRERLHKPHDNLHNRGTYLHEETGPNEVVYLKKGLTGKRGVLTTVMKPVPPTHRGSGFPGCCRFSVTPNCRLILSSSRLSVLIASCETATIYTRLNKAWCYFSDTLLYCPVGRTLHPLTIHLTLWINF